jgi:hypothetical protein
VGCGRGHRGGSSRATSPRGMMSVNRGARGVVARPVS